MALVQKDIFDDSPFKKRKTERNTDLCKEDWPEDPEVVKLLVDGKPFRTTRSVLRQAGEESYLGRLVSSDFSLPVRKEKGSIVINDRSNKRFREILEYLRLGPHFVPPRSQMARDELWAEALFFGLPDLARLVGRCRIFHISHKTLIQESDNKMLLTRNNAAGVVRISVSDLPYFFVSGSVEPRQETICKWHVGLWSCEDPSLDDQNTVTRLLPCSELTWKPTSRSFCIQDSTESNVSGPVICEGISPYGPLIRDGNSEDNPYFELSLLDKRPLSAKMPPFPQRLIDALTLSEFSNLLRNSPAPSNLELWPEEALFLTETETTGPSQLEFRFPCRAQPVVRAAARYQSASVEHVVWIRWGDARSCIVAHCLGKPQRLFLCEGRGARSIGVHRVNQEASLMIDQTDLGFLPLDGIVSHVSLSITLPIAGQAITYKLRP